MSNQDQDQDISGLEFIVKENKSFTPGTTNSKIVEDEWFPAKLVQFKPFVGNFGKQIRWVFELQGSDYAWKNEKEGKTGQLRVTVPTTYNCSPKSNLYKLYSKLIGRELKIGETISLKNILNVSCYVMIKINKRKNDEGGEDVFYNVDKVKLREVKTEAPAQQPVAQPTQQTQPAPQQQPVAQQPAAQSQIIDDIFTE